MKHVRSGIHREIEHIILYKSARTCCVCRGQGKPLHIHHIDGDPSNNSLENLAFLCTLCHDEAHTIHKLSKNLTAKRLKDFKQSWEQEVAQRATNAMLPASNLDQAIWTFVNHQRLPALMKSHGIKFRSELLRYLVNQKVVDKNGIPFTSGTPEGNQLITIYDYFDFGDRHRLHFMYTEAVDSLIEAVQPIELGSIWSKREIQDIIRPGSYCFCMRGFYFKPIEQANKEEVREVYARANGIEVRCIANTRHMFGSSALYDAFTGHRFAAVFMLVRHISREGRKLKIHATPIAMGMGFVPYAYKTVHQLKYGWAKGKV
jgi:hypothetical protein